MTPLSKLRTHLITLLAATLILGGCSTMKTTEMPPDELHRAIRAGELVSAGERVQLVTTDGTNREFTVTELDDQSIRGADVEVPIDEVVALKTRQVSAGKTTLLVGGAIGMGVLIGVLIAPAAILAVAAP